MNLGPLRSPWPFPVPPGWGDAPDWLFSGQGGRMPQSAKSTIPRIAVNPFSIGTPEKNGIAPAKQEMHKE